MPKEQPTSQVTRPAKNSVKPTEPTIPEQIAELLARALVRLNGAPVPMPAL